MKTLHLTIITSIGVTTVVIISILFFFQSIIPGTMENTESNSLDLSNPTNENPLGITGQVIMEPDQSTMCPVKCVIPPTPHLVLTSDRGAQFISYQVCDGDSCKKDKLENSFYVSLNQTPQNYTGSTALTASHINLGNLPWNVGDAVHIMVKAFPVILEPNDIITREPKAMVVDLGESKIIENITNSTSSLSTALSSIVFPTVTMESFDGVSVKGYLTNQNGTGLANQEIMFYLNNATFDNGTTISENLLMGKTTTNQTGCFYFADWDANKSLQFHNEVFTTSPSGNSLVGASDNVLVYVNTVFAGTTNLSGSSNATKIMYHPIVAPIIREAGINAYLVNASSYFPHYSPIPILEVEREKSYNFIAFSSWSESLNVQTFRLEIKNLPCGINVQPVDISDLKNKTQAIIPVKMILDKTAPVGSFFPYVSVNNQVTGPLDLEVK